MIALSFCRFKTDLGQDPYIFQSSLNNFGLKLTLLFTKNFAMLPILYFLNYYPGKLTKLAILNVQKILCTEFVNKNGEIIQGGF